MKIQNLNCKYGKSTLLHDVLFSSIIFILLCFFAFVSEIWFSVYQVEQTSMEPTLYTKDILVVDKLSDYDRYDIIVFKRNGSFLVKRVIAFEGETVYAKDGIVHIERLINGRVVDIKLDEPYLKGMQTSQLNEKIQVKKGEIFVLGDNRVVSNDSRHFGCIEKSQVIGVVHEFFIDNKETITNLLG